MGGWAGRKCQCRGMMGRWAGHTHVGGARGIARWASSKDIFFLKHNEYNIFNLVPFILNFNCTMLFN